MKAISLFTGIGGLDLAAESLGIEVVDMVEKCDWCKAILKSRFSSNVYSDILEYSPKYKVDLVFGGFPCQPFSVAGSRKGEEDERYLWGEMLRVIRESNPRWVVGENVKGLLTSGIERIQSDLEQEGYKVWVHLFSASSIGAIHQRERLFIVGYKARGQATNTTSYGRNGCKELTGDTQTNDGSTERQNQAKRPERCGGLRPVLRFSEHQKEWGAVPSILRVDDGVSRKLDKLRIKALGNAVSPQQAKVIFNTVVAMDSALGHS